MTIYKFPSEFRKARESAKEKKSHVHHPEFIDIEDLQEETVYAEDVSDVFSSVGGIDNMEMPFLIRVFSFIISSALFVGSGLLLIISLVSTVFSLLAFRMTEPVNQASLRYWKYSKRTFVTALGLLIMCISPALGMGFIVLYFGLQGESMEGHFLNKFFHPQ